MTTRDSFFDAYVSPLSQRNASREMLEIWSPRRRFELWRKIWLAVADAQQELGLPITEAQIEALETHLEVTDEQMRRAAEHERRLRHDVMAHVHALGEVAPEARPILHLGMTSQDVVCNADIMLFRQALELVSAKLARGIDALAAFAEKHKSLPALGYTHFQPAQPITVGRRAAQWAYDLCVCLTRIESNLHHLKLRGLKGATGTQASFMSLMDNNDDKVDQLEDKFVRASGWMGKMVHDLTAQTYPRVVDAFVVSDLAATAAAVHKICNDIRLLCNRKELDEPFGESQVGSSAMPYKQNPMRCERATGLCRFVITLAHSPLDTAATQWLERTLDDSANRRLVLPEAFLALDGALDLLHNVASGLVVHEATVRANLMLELPFMVTENILMAAVRAGRDRQEVHEVIRKHALQAAHRVKQQGLPNDMIDRLRAEPVLRGVPLDEVLDPAAYIGRCVQQVDKFLADTVRSIREAYRPKYEQLSPSEPRV